MLTYKVKVQRKVTDLNGCERNCKIHIYTFVVVRIPRCQL